MSYFGRRVRGGAHLQYGPRACITRALPRDVKASVSRIFLTCFLIHVSLDLAGYKELLTPAVADSGAGGSAAAGPGVGTVGLKKLWKSVTF